MPSKVVFLYRSFPEKVNELVEKEKNGVYIRPGTVLVGIDLESVTQWKRKELERSYLLREFEVEQDKFVQLIRNFPKIGARLINIEIVRSFAEPELLAQLNDAIARQNLADVIDIVSVFSDLGHDVHSVEFFWQDKTIRFTRLAELDIISKNPDIFSLLNTAPIGYLSGVLREDELETNV